MATAIITVLKLRRIRYPYATRGVYMHDDVPASPPRALTTVGDRSVYRSNVWARFSKGKVYVSLYPREATLRQQTYSIRQVLGVVCTNRSEIVRESVVSVP